MTQTNRPLEVKFVRYYDIGRDELVQCPVSAESAAVAAAAQRTVSDEPRADLPIRSRLESERHLVWTTPEEWTGAL